METQNISDVSAGKPEQNWWERNNDWIMPLVTAGATAINPALGAAVGAASAGYLSYENQKYNEEVQHWNLTQQLLAEQRSNEEYAKRLKEQNEYSEGWANRLRKEGFNPLFQISKGQAGAMASSSPTAPMSSVPQALSKQPSLAELLTAQKASADIRLLNAQADQIESQTDKTNEEGRAQFLENCITQFMYGEAPDIVQEERLFEVRYGANVDDEGNVTFENLGNVKRKYRMYVNLYKYTSDTYGEFVISEGSYNVRKAREELLSLVGNNYQVAEDLAQSWAGLYTTVMQGFASGKQADAAMITALAKDLEANYKFGDEFNTKWYIEQAFNLVDAGVSLVDSIARLKSLVLANKPKVTKRERHTYTSKSGTDTYETTTTN